MARLATTLKSFGIDWRDLLEVDGVRPDRTQLCGAAAISYAHAAEWITNSAPQWWDVQEVTADASP